MYIDIDLLNSDFHISGPHSNNISVYIAGSIFSVFSLLYTIDSLNLTVSMVSIERKYIRITLKK